MNSRAHATRLPLDPGADPIESPAATSNTRSTGEVIAFSRPLTVLVAVPTLHAGAADAGAIDLVRILKSSGHRVIVASRGGRMEDEIDALGAEFVRLDVESHNPLVMLRSSFALARIIRERRCDLVHAHGRAAACSACLAARMSRRPS